MVRGTDWYSSSIYRAGWKSEEGYVKAQEVSYVGMYVVPHPLNFKERVRWWAKTLKDILLEEDEDEEDKILDNCTKKGLKVFASRKG